MQDRFNECAQLMPKYMNKLKASPQYYRNELGDIPESGIYVFYEKGKAIYVGRSKGLKERIQQHSRPSSMHNSASFAFRIAKEEWARHHKDSKYGTRKDLESAPGFRRIFDKARDRVARMKIRVVDIKDPVTQALFEIYAALELKTTKYNDFDTH